jgi:hypothetical protein
VVAGRGVHIISGGDAVEPEFLYVQLFRPGVQLCLVLNAVDIVLDGPAFACVKSMLLACMTSRMRSCVYISCYVSDSRKVEARVDSAWMWLLLPVKCG